MYGIHKNGHVTQVFESIYEAMRSFGEEDKGKGICTSIKWGSRWKGYLWYKADTLEWNLLHTLGYLVFRVDMDNRTWVD